MIEVLPESGGRLTVEQAQALRPGTRVRWQGRATHFGKVTSPGRDGLVHAAREPDGSMAVLDVRVTPVFNLGRQ